MDVRSRRARESSSPDRAKTFVQQQPRIKPSIKRVQVVYYLTRNGHLEHPHYIEVTHFPNQPLRLKDVMDRLTLLRGKSMPSLYSWSCKRSYKNGYVWNDLAENDVISPADGAEYVLKGSELLETCSEKFEQLHVGNTRQQMIQEPSSYHLHTKAKSVVLTPNHQHQAPEEYHQEDDQEDEEDYEEEKTSYTTSSTTPRSLCSRGVSTDESLEDEESKNPNPNNRSSNITTTNSNIASKRFEDGDPVTSRSSSVLLQLISCGNLAVSKAKSLPSFKQPTAVAVSNNNNSHNNGIVMKKKSISDNLQKEVLCKSVLMKVAEGEDEENLIISYMSENPRFGNFQSEEKEYFSGSIVESATKDHVQVQPVLKKSNSYNEERSRKAGKGEAVIMEVEEKKRSNYAVKVKCIPRKKASASSKKTKK